MMFHQFLNVFEDNSTLKPFFPLASVHFRTSMTLSLHGRSDNCIIYIIGLLLDAKVKLFFCMYENTDLNVRKLQT